MTGREVSRRAFVKTGVMGSALSFIGAGVKRPGSVVGDAPPQGSFELEEVTIAQLQEWMRSGRYTARQIGEQYLARIDAVDGRGPTLRSVLEVNPDALAIADQLDAERRSRGPRGPLHGVPVLIKDNIDTADRMHTSAGSLALAESSHRGTPSLRSGYGLPARSSLARPTSRSGPTSAPTAPAAGGAGAAGSAGIPTSSTGRRRDRAAAPAPLPRPTSAPLPSAPRPTARSRRRARLARWSASSRRWDCGAAVGSSRSRFLATADLGVRD